MTIICNVDSGINFSGKIFADDYFFGIYSFLDRKEILNTKYKKQHRKSFMPYGYTKASQSAIYPAMTFSAVFRLCNCCENIMTWSHL